jgi:hypothetical protein
LVEAAALIGAHERAQRSLFELRFEAVPQGFVPVGITAAAAMSGLAPIAADEDVAGEQGH